MLMTEKIDRIIDDYSFNGQVLLVDSNGKSVYHKCFGTTREDGKNINDSTKFDIADATAGFTLVAALKLSEEKKLDITRKITEFYPALIYANEITVKHLMQYKSGLQNFVTDNLWIEFYKENKGEIDAEYMAKKLRLCQKNYTPDDVVEMIKNMPLKHKTGGERDGGNVTDYVLLGGILEQVTGKTLGALLEELIFKPLDLSDTTFGKGDGHEGYFRFENAEVPVRVGKSVAANGSMGVSTTARDVTRFMRALLGNELLSEKLKKFFFSKKDKCCCFYEDGFWYVLEGYCGGSAAILLLDVKTKLSLTVMCAETIKYIKLSRQKNKYFMTELITAVQSEYLRYTAPKLVKLNMDICWNVANIEIKEEQNFFVCPPLDAMAMCASSKNLRGFAVTDREIIVGLIVLLLDKKGDQYWIDVFMVDKNYQGRGYGKAAIALGRDYLIAHGAKKAQIAFNQRNKAAEHVYESCGFVSVGAFSQGVRMEYVPK